MAESSVPKEIWVEEKFEVVVKNQDEKTYVIEVSKHEAISSFRQKVAKTLSIPVNMLRLTSQAGRTLENDRSLWDYDINRHSTIHCQGRDKEQHEQALDNSPHSQERVCSGPYGMTSNNSETEAGDGDLGNLSQASPPQEMADSTVPKQMWVEENFELSVKNQDGRTYIIVVNRNEKISSLRQKVCKECGIPKKHMRLTSQGGRTLEDGRYLRDYDINRHSTINCQGRVREEHEQALDNPLHSQERVCSGLPGMTSNNSESQAGDGGFGNLSQASPPQAMADSTVPKQMWVEENFELFVKNMDGKTYIFEVNRNEKISSLRQKVCTKFGYPENYMRLIFAGRNLEDGRCLRDYDISRHSTIFCQGRLRGGHDGL